MQLEQLQEKLKHCNVAEISRNTGIHINTIYAIKKGVGNPTAKTIEKLSHFFNIN